MFPLETLESITVIRSIHNMKLIKFLYTSVSVKPKTSISVSLSAITVYHFSDSLIVALAADSRLARPIADASFFTDTPISMIRFNSSSVWALKSANQILALKQLNINHSLYSSSSFATGM
jgi:hypothetical protein